MNRFRSIVPVGLIILFVFIFFCPFLVSRKIPIPADTIVGLYHPFRDLYAKEYPNGIPYKNFLITDPVRQQYPWRNLVIENVQKMELPLWNPYNLSGTPLLANIQSATFYPGNILFSFLPFMYAWSMLILLQPLMAAIFLYMYLQNLRISKEGSILGSLAFSFSGFFVAWLEWGTVLNVALWLPLVLLSIDKIVAQTKNKLLWSSLFLFSLCASFFAGHLQTFFYLFLLVVIYFLARWFQFRRKSKILLLFLLLTSLFLLLTFIQWYPTLQLILESARDIDQADWTKPGWFIPWQHSVQFIVPDFFGNPTSLNYWGEWNYGEFIGYIGIIPLLMALFALVFRRDKKTLFFGSIFLTTLLFAFPTPLAQIPYVLSLPFISTAQPTRLLFLIDFSLAVLAAFGMDYFIKYPKKILVTLGILFGVFSITWLFVLLEQNILSSISVENIAIAKRNLILPTGVFLGAILLCYLYSAFMQKKYTIFIIWFLIGVTAFDLFRFAIKFTPFTNGAYIYPSTKTTQFLQKQPGQFRIMATDSRVFPPNFPAMYHIQSIEGYDPLYLRRYGELIAASERKSPDISSPFGFNRIITPHNYDSKIIDLLNVRYVLSLSDIDSPKLKKVFQEGETRIYENMNVLPRVFFVEETKLANTKQESIKLLMNKNTNLLETAIIEFEADLLFSDIDQKKWIPNNETIKWSVGKATLSQYEENKIVIQTENKGRGFLVLTDIYFPLWKATIDGKPTSIIRTNYLFRGIIIPSGKHTINFYTSLF